jgi:tetratricopeptide (TPR) repeat protein
MGESPVPLVGRKAQLELMREVVEQAVDFRAPQVLTIIGNQGTGKTRLVDELVHESLRDAIAVGELRVCRGHAVSGDERYAAVARLLRDRFDLGSGPLDATALDCLRAEVEAVFDGEPVEEMLHFLGSFLGIEAPASPFLRLIGDDPALRAGVALTVIRRFFEVDAERSPLLLIFDDLQWADEASLAVLEALGTGLGGSPVVLIVCTRPELTVRFSEWRWVNTDHRRIDLRNLEPRDAAAMLGELLSGCGELPVESVDDALELTGGNPRCIEELVRMYHENGTVDTSVTPWRFDPERAAATELSLGIEEAIEARIAALDRQEREVLEKGAVFGNVFWTGAVVALSRIEQLADGGNAPVEPGRSELWDRWGDEEDPVQSAVLRTMRGLVERDYLLEIEIEDSTILNDVEMVFKHNLERDLIARSTEAKKMARYHRLAAQWLEARLAARSEEQLEFLAQLYEGGGERRRSAQCYQAGGDKARLRYANQQAVELYTRALAALEEDDGLARLDVLHNLGSVLDRVGRSDEAMSRFQELLRLSWLFDHKGKGGAAHSRLGRIQRRRGEYDQAMQHFRQASELFKQAGDQVGVASTLDDIGKVHWYRGAYGQALEFHRQALAIRRALGDRQSIALSLANIGRVHNDSGAFKAAIAQFREALDLRRDIGDLSGVVQSLCDLGGVHVADGNHEMALEMFSEARKIAQQIEDKVAQMEVLGRLGECKSAMGRGTEAVEHLHEAAALANALGDRVALSDCHRRLSEVWLALGDPGQAIEEARRGLELSEAVGSRVQVAMAYRALAEATAAAPELPDAGSRAEAHFRKAIDILTSMRNELELARCFRSFAALCERTGAAEQAGKLRRRADEIFGRLHGAAATE